MQITPFEFLPATSSGFYLSKKLILDDDRILLKKTLQVMVKEGAIHRLFKEHMPKWEGIESVFLAPAD